MFTNETGIVAQELSEVLHNWVTDSQSEVEQDSKAESNIIFSTGTNGGEMLRVAEDGFYVRGVKVPVDENEAATVYRVFREWLTWAHLTLDQ